jgi:signal transduction histidine kinase
VPLRFSGPWSCITDVSGASSRSLTVVKTMEPRREHRTPDLPKVRRKARETSNRFADDDLRLENKQLRELNRDLEVRMASRTAQLATANLIKDQLLASERKAREEAERSNRVKSDFLALLSHEFRTPLQAVFGYTELLDAEIHGELNESQRRYVHRIKQSQEHLLGLINTILEFAKLEGEQQDLRSHCASRARTRSSS